MTTICYYYDVLLSSTSNIILYFLTSIKGVKYLMETFNNNLHIQMARLIHEQ